MPMMRRRPRPHALSTSMVMRTCLSFPRFCRLPPSASALCCCTSCLALYRSRSKNNPSTIHGRHLAPPCDPATALLATSFRLVPAPPHPLSDLQFCGKPGNAGCRLDADDLVDEYLERGVSFFTFDFEGSGNSVRQRPFPCRSLEFGFLVCFVQWRWGLGIRREGFRPCSVEQQGAAAATFPRPPKDTTSVPSNRPRARTRLAKPDRKEKLNRRRGAM